MRYSNSLDILGIPSLPAHAFKHVGNRQIKLYGDDPVSNFVDDVLGIDDSGGVVGSVSEGAAKVEDVVREVAPQVEDVVKDVGSKVEDVVGGVSEGVAKVEDVVVDVGAQVDDFVNESIPGGWATVAVVTGSYYYYTAAATPASLSGIEGVALTEAEAATLAASEATASNTLATANTTAYSNLANPALNSIPAGAYTGVTTTSLPQTFGNYDLASSTPIDRLGVKATPSTTVLPGGGTPVNYELAAPAKVGISQGLTPNLDSSLNPFAPTGMGGAQGLTVPSATGTGTVSAAGTFAPVTPFSSIPGSGKNIYNPISDRQKLPTRKEKEKGTEGKDVTAAVSLLLDLLSERTQSTRGSRSYAAGGAVEPTSPSATTGTASTTTLASGMTAAAAPAGTTTAAAPSTAVTSTDVFAPSAITEDKITTDTAQTKLVTSLTGVSAEQGIVSEGAKAAAATVVPTVTDVGKEPAAQGVATQVVAPQKRTAQAGEIVSGSAVDQTAVEAALAKTQAAQGAVTEEMTTQGQLNKLLTNFDAGNPPPWAAASMRGATAQLAARGLGVSSMAGQAIVQATLEAALPIAATDAKVFEQMGLQNLSNRQQTAMILGEQRAKFLGQEFDQNFQTKVLNAARIADIADKNFTADVTIALENARITGTMDLQNLSNKQALVLAKTAQVATLETTNLNNRQQVAVENSKAFLTLDVKNLDNKQQTALFKAKEIADSIITDTAAANAAKATNAANALEADKINAQLALSASQYNTAEKNKVAMFNKSAADELTKFNAQEANDRADFNANLSTQISIANAKLLADVSTANTRETNAMAAVNAKNATDLSASTYAQLSQTYRDQLETAWKTSDNTEARANEISKVTLTSNATKYAGDAAADAAYYAALGSLSAALLTSSGGTKIADTLGTKLSDWLLGQ